MARRDEGPPPAECPSRENGGPVLLEKSTKNMKGRDVRYWLDQKIFSTLDNFRPHLQHKLVQSCGQVRRKLKTGFGVPQGTRIAPPALFFSGVTVSYSLFGSAIAHASIAAQRATTDRRA